MPGGYDAIVSERGQNLSGGQRQRLALARIFLKNPPVLILDEATSALDNISERRVQRAHPGGARADRTKVIVVAHRLSTLRDDGRIFVFDEGQVVETGTYDELSSTGSRSTSPSSSTRPAAPTPSRTTRRRSRPRSSCRCPTWRSSSCRRSEADSACVRHPS